MTQAEALDILKSGHNVYLTGSAGSGKTYVLNKYIEYLQANNVEVGITASTGIAATHMNGVTIHSWSGLGIRNHLSDMELDAMEERQYLWTRFSKAKVLIIDEVSMLHHYRLDLIERICRSFKRNELPFGGLQVVLCGDFFQLPPVSRNGEPEAKFVYHADTWQAMDLRVCYLHEQFRQSDQAFLQVLNDIRGNTVSEDTLNHLRGRYKKEPVSKILPTKLYTHNVDIDVINAAELAKLPGEVHRYDSTDSGKDALVEALKKSCMAPEVLELKKGAVVMFVKNNFEAGYVNGTLGEVVDFDDDDWPIVKIANGHKIIAAPLDWQIAEGGKVLAEISQVPLRLAWAITVHKSQGMSLDAVEVDLSKSFEPGMGYVALSRARSLDGLKLLGLNDVALQVNAEVAAFDELLKKLSAKAEKEISKMTPAAKKTAHKKFITKVAPKKTIK